MKNFSSSDIYSRPFTFAGEPYGYKKISVNNNGDLIINELPWQKLGLSYTRTGYGNKIPTRYMIQIDGRKYRIYTRCFSNAGTSYIIFKGEEVVID